LELDSNFAGRVKQLIIMGGAFGYNRHSGNVSPVAEANIASDPQAADIVFRSGMATTIVGLDVTHEIIMDRPYMQSLLECGGEAGKFIASSHQYYLDFHNSLSGRFECPLHDSAAIAYLLAPDLFATINQPVRAVTEGIAMGQTIHGDDLREYVSSAWDDVADSTICIGVDGPAVLELCRSILSTATKNRNI
jgi:inosine-uridine nucleoside N-ribohydrolase